MATRRRLGALVAGSMLAATLGVGSVAATDRGTYNFYDCNQAPWSFTATKTTTRYGVSGASAFHIANSRDLFVVLGFGELNSGIAKSGQATLWCQVNTSQGTFTFYGFLVTTG